LCGKVCQVVAIALSSSVSNKQPGHDLTSVWLCLKMVLISTFLPGKKLASNAWLFLISRIDLRSCSAYSPCFTFRSPGMSLNRAVGTDFSTSQELISSKCIGATRPKASVRINASCIQHGSNSQGTRVWRSRTIL
jgi:hypothetical protein